MITRNGKEVSAIYHGNREIVEVYKGLKLVWQAVNSCFGSGAWLNDRPWSNTDGWKN